MKRALVARVAWLGGLGGAVNAALCFTGWPAPAADGMDFSPWIVPAGFAHGALLACGAVNGLVLLHRTRFAFRIVVAPIVGWIVGWLTFIPLHLAILAMPISLGPVLGTGKPSGVSGRDIAKALWPFEWNVETLWIPFLNFGAVAVAYWFLRLLPVRAGERPPVVVALWVGVGALGSLWWWASYGPWWFSMLHGAIWGGLVGVAHIFPQAKPQT